MKEVLAVIALTAMSAVCSTPAGSSPPSATDRCDAVQMPDLQGGEHLIGDREPPVPYSSTPPTSGWHSSGAFDIAIQPAADPLTEAEQVIVLEAGGVVVTVNNLDGGDQVTLEQRVAERYAGRVAVTSYDKLGQGEVAFTGWGVVQQCEGVDLEALDAFVAAYADERPANPGDQ
ncbi:MAG: DUF3105 domain-containing protein [Nitriliruptorales bacterium]|nr:DUF3105 domain-containing protein [Nitriliruptorales bacterium]